MVRRAEVGGVETKKVSIGSPFLHPEKAISPCCLQVTAQQILVGGLESLEHAGQVVAPEAAAEEKEEDSRNLVFVKGLTL